jgi:prepilin-type N-terminal cleavage/methylation domain-containing protein
MLKKIRNTRAFTLIELLVSIVIAGIIAAIVIPTIVGITISSDYEEVEIIDQSEEPPLINEKGELNQL